MRVASRYHNPASWQEKERTAACTRLRWNRPACAHPKRHVLFPRDPDHDSQTVSLGQIEKPGRRDAIAANRVDTVCGHCRKVGRGDRRFKLIPGLVRTERAMGNSTDEESF